MKCRASTTASLAIPALAGVALALALPAAAAVATSGPELGPLLCGTSSYVDGTFVWTDYAYDDRGANAHTDPADPAGDTRYPAGQENSADLIQLQVALTPDGVRIRAILETLVDASLPVLGVAFDTDANPTTGAAALPGAGWVPQGPLGVEVLVVVDAAGASVERYSAGSWVPAGSLAGGIDPASNVIEVTLPSAVADPGSSTWRAFAVLGFEDANTSSWRDGGPIYGLGLEPNPTFAVAGNCDVSGNDSCNGQDANSVKRAALGVEPNPLFGQNCHNATGAPVPPDL